MIAATTLVIDDEPMVRNLVRRILEPEVCGVVDVGDGETGLELIQRRRESIDVVLTDLSMPGIDGFDLVDVLTEHHPDLPVACMSAYVNPYNVERRLSVPLLSKPFTTDGLCGLIVPLLQQTRQLRGGAHKQRERAGATRTESEALRARTQMSVARAVDLIAIARAVHSSRANRHRQD